MKDYGFLLRMLHCSISQSMTNALTQMELTSSQGHIMGYLSHCKEPPCPRDVEEHFGLSHPTVSGLLARLEKKGFLAMRPDPVDKRCKRIYILPKGTECHDRMHGVISSNNARIVNGFTEEEQAQFADFLTRAAQNMGCEMRK